eukprot:6267220-Amphidinium_carterae.1
MDKAQLPAVKLAQAGAADYLLAIPVQPVAEGEEGKCGTTRLEHVAFDGTRHRSQRVQRYNESIINKNDGGVRVSLSNVPGAIFAPTSNLCALASSGCHTCLFPEPILTINVKSEKARQRGVQHTPNPSETSHKQEHLPRRDQLTPTMPPTPVLQFPPFWYDRESTRKAKSLCVSGKTSKHMTFKRDVKT